MSTMEPLKVTFKVSGGFLPPAFPMHLDGILAYHVTRQNSGVLARRGMLTVEELRKLSDNLPLSRHEQDGEWCWKASAIMPVGPVEVMPRFYTQRRDTSEYATSVAAGKIQHGRLVIHPDKPLERNSYQMDTLRGVYRNLLGYYSVIKSAGVQSGHLELVCWCIGDKDAIESRLNDGLITHLGAKRRIGHGRIESITVEKDPDAKENWKIRVRPWKLLDCDTNIQAAWKAPYWESENKGQAFCPVDIL